MRAIPHKDINDEAEFVLDIMNAHYPNYYGEKKATTNDQNPNPVTFLTVTNTTFMFASHKSWEESSAGRFTQTGYE